MSKPKAGKSADLDSTLNRNIQEKFDLVFGEGESSDFAEEAKDKTENDVSATNKAEGEEGSDGGFELDLDQISQEQDIGELTQKTLVMNAKDIVKELKSVQEEEKKKPEGPKPQTMPKPGAALKVAPEPAPEVEEELAEEISFAVEEEAAPEGDDGGGLDFSGPEAEGESAQPEGGLELGGGDDDEFELESSAKPKKTEVEAEERPAPAAKKTKAPVEVSEDEEVGLSFDAEVVDEGTATEAEDESGGMEFSAEEVEAPAEAAEEEEVRPRMATKAERTAATDVQKAMTQMKKPGGGFDEEETDEDDQATQIISAEDEDEKDTMLFSTDDIAADENTDESATAYLGRDERPASSANRDEALWSGAGEEDMVRGQALLRQLRMEREDLLKNIENLKRDHQLVHQDNLGLRAELDEVKIELSLVRKRAKNELDETQHKLKLHEEKKGLLEEKQKSFQKEYERLNQKVRIDLNKVKRREKELEGQLEMVSMDAESQVKSRDNKILELKRKIDSLEFNMENISIREQKMREDKVKLEERLDKIMHTLRGSIKLLEDDLGFDQEVLDKINKL